ncbi:MAG: L-aspartate oxidase [Candidatus Gracilibacteria bacterium]|jgi:L-aspartate oxidase
METNFLVIGSGIAGLTFALKASEKSRVILVTKGKMSDGSTNLAQGGIVGVIDKNDSFKSHIEDTIKAGSYHNDKKAVKFLSEHSPAAINFLIKLEVPFRKENGKLLMTQEGGHSMRRIAFTSDQTGHEIEKALINKVKKTKSIQIIENAFALDLITKNKRCYGATIVLNKKVIQIFADYTAICTGGTGQLFKKTTNPKVATGDGIAMGIRAGAKTKDLEFVQFHPTAFDSNESPLFLISETVRGEGAKLLNNKGERFVDELKPRDIVARAVYEESKKGKVWLDITHRDKNFLQKRFPGIYAHLKKHKILMEKNRIPITPVAHYLCGGLVTDLKGQTNIKNLLAFGECACTGVHGANRIASNSLLEGVVFSLNAAKFLKLGSKKPIKQIATYAKSSTFKSNTKKEIQEIMWQYAGITRNLNQIKKIAIPKIQRILTQLPKNSSDKKTTEVKNMAQVSLVILKSAAARKKSLGCHFVN